MPNVVKTHICKKGVVRRFTAAEWASLELFGYQGRLKGVLKRTLELRICDVCGSCISVPVDADTERYLEQLDDEAAPIFRRCA